jgi:hypothetical protein
LQNERDNIALDALKRFQTIEDMLALLEAGTMTAILDWQQPAGISRFFSD